MRPLAIAAMQIAPEPGDVGGTWKRFSEQVGESGDAVGGAAGYQALCGWAGLDAGMWGGGGRVRGASGDDGRSSRR